ncbi:hypothetical protein HaLaN_06840 [Haematococcus lacustris]|uniref:Uncharacterized protein n=1 Tax=Haematococcus lacustris TaxID=44745 RepID=A0A699YQ13_HAELA|nr:hypothetical protein HaLaN_06840 [Haematococcus lacustris]
MDQRITVNVVDASGNSTTLTATPPVNTSSFIKTLVLGHGAGILVKGQNEMVLDEILPAGTYNWRVTAVAQAAEAQAALITHEAHMAAAATQQARVTGGWDVWEDVERGVVISAHIVHTGRFISALLACKAKPLTNSVFKTLMGSRAFGELHNTDMDFRNPIGVGPLKSALAFQVGKV